MLFVFAIFLIFVKESLTTEQTHKALQGSNVFLPCEHHLTDWITGLYWKLNLPPLPDHSNSNPFTPFTGINKDPRLLQYTQNNLVFEKVLLEDEGEYTCKIFEDPKDNIEYNRETNESKEAQEIRSHITYKLHIEGTLNNEANDNETNSKESASENFVIIKAKLNDRLILPCEGINLQTPELIWIKTEALPNQDSHSTLSIKKLLLPDSRIKLMQGYNFEIQNVHPDDAGSYTCKAFDYSSHEQITIASYKLEVLSNSHDVCSTAAARLSCGIHSECYPYEDKPKCSCRKQYSGRPPYCSSTCPDRNCPLITCTSPWCKALCEQSCASKDLCMIQNYKYTCLCNKNYTGTIYEKCSGNISPGLIFDMSKASTIGLVLLIIGVTSQL